VDCRPTTSPTHGDMIVELHGRIFGADQRPWGPPPTRLVVAGQQFGIGRSRPRHGQPRRGRDRSKVKCFIDDVFTATLDEAPAKEAVDYGKKTTLVEPELMQDVEWLSMEFEHEATFIASPCQVHHHTATYVKYSIK
jgi:hypothetical protein